MKVAYFFYSFNTTRRQQGIYGLCSLALQLLDHLKPIIPDNVVATYETEMRNHALTLSDPHTAAHVVRDLAGQCDKVYMVIDGLDECTDEELTIRTLELLWGLGTYGIVKWLVTSRDQFNIRTTMKRQGAVEVRPSPQVITEDIRSYFSSHVDCQSCVDQWTDGEDNFLYAKFVCDKLCGKGLTCKDEIKKALEKFPRGLNAYYTRTLEKLALRTEEEQELVR